MVGRLNLTFGPGRTQKPKALGLNQIHTEASDQRKSDKSLAVDLGFSSSHETEGSWAFFFSWHSLSANTDIIMPFCTARRNIPFETWLFSCQVKMITHGVKTAPKMNFYFSRGELYMLCRDQAVEKRFYGKLKCLWREAACLGGVAVSALLTVSCAVAAALTSTQ